MARRSAAEKAETHERIVQHASEIFRARGSGVGIGDVMNELGLTHGGFYRHFESKEALLVEAVAQSLTEIAVKLEHIAEQAPAGTELAAIISAYLSTDHLRHPESWCVLATLAPELARLPPGVRKKLDAAMQMYMQRLARFMPGSTDAERAQSFFLLFSGMAGTIAMTRVVADARGREQMLVMARAYYLKTFADAPS
jgi:TetR/AcrR family transcriptional repressor of nem operon